ncbi:DUF935 family protein [Mucilaginibacter gossypii]|uniref:phage portal protein family protein n=1 Tax=Mucilaginibacter gossypii TaxID=551996 RepID=UPI000DCD2883|nr:MULTISPECIES: DUF935 family protein [Mucilaginibacter]QTE36017.1 DUF935 family protein [Mucilaginibacter gossypii]RAV56690.1 hypothetical protein DIU36_14915 [Mucilaginibacter rubeus]
MNLITTIKNWFGGSSTSADTTQYAEPLDLISLAASQKQQGIITDDTKKRYLDYDVKAIFRTRMDIKNWNASIDQYQYMQPKNWMIQLLYNEILIDAMLFSQYQNRGHRLFSLDFNLKNPDGSNNEEQKAILKNMPFYRFANWEKYKSILLGYSVVELSIGKTVDGKPFLIGDSIPRTNIVPQTGLFYSDYYDDVNVVKYREMPEYGTWLLEYNSKDIGLLNKTVPHVLFKRFAQSCWSELCEIYGIPPRVLTTNTQDKTMLNRAQKMMRDMGAAAWFIIDEDEKFEWAQGVATNGDVYKNLIDLCRDEICLVIAGAIIGQDTKNGSRSKDQTAQEMLLLLQKSDMATLQEYWNNITIPALKKHGFLKGDLTFEFVPNEDTAELVDWILKFAEYFEIDIDWIKQKTGIEIVKARETPVPAADKATKKLKADLLEDDDFFGKARQRLSA